MKVVLNRKMVLKRISGGEIHGMFLRIHLVFLDD